MKTLYLVRHAKSGWSIDNQPDIDRPLNERGYDDAHLVSKHLHKQTVKPGIIISSPAIRAMSTALIFAGNLRFSKEHIAIKEKLYETDRDDYLECINELDENCSNAMIFGHNPIISETAQFLIDDKMDEMATCSVAVIIFDTNSWKNIKKSSGKLEMLYTSSQLKD